MSYAGSYGNQASPDDANRTATQATEDQAE